MTTERGTARRLLDASKSLMTRPERLLTGAWSRASAFLIRQALEATIDALWARTSPGMREVSMRAQLVCLPEFLRDAPFAGRVVTTWCALSRACHSHPYELSPTVEEVERWTRVVRELGERVDAK